ncbi:UDP-glucuronate:xylan alpha-glucuronosyltransferase 1-like [Phalaenopsis equestris]|uniref:UDP-glucuronate:xylan alpha-glucuronosyltransferase 1-like n=1 Tax=Phalaenopsis equestris TaxID=78828 RepID=UPI0009E358B2|nr:UDP-glucuronate:xylan alpha-glucuronosyltransferase 1-like [Phalaenopsis equestris]XP_020588044.1 UDP-glucuronate:xylan alpha-glucuronosyltransferase 1-like [Phalaenopsis equestris]
MKRLVGLMEARHRLAGSLSDASRRRTYKSSSPKETAKLANSCQERSSNSKLHWLKCLTVFLMLGILFKLFYSPLKCRYAKSSYSFARSSFASVGWMWSEKIPDQRYTSNLNTPWAQTLQITKKLHEKKENLNVGLLNFNSTEIKLWQNLFPTSKISEVHLDRAAIDLTWDDLYPEWIDEEEESDEPYCKKLPYPKLPKGSQFGLVAVKLPCNKTGNWTRDIARLHLQHVAAKLSVEMKEGHDPAHVLLVTDCLPIPNLFSCKRLVERKGDVWLYKPDLQVLKQKLEFPIGSCRLSLPFEHKVRPSSTNARREAYATILHSEDEYVCGAIAAAQSIRLTGSTRDLVILVDETISSRYKNGLEAAGWKIKKIKRIRNPKATKDAYNEWNYSKFRLWQLTEYDKIIFIDADLLVLRNIDFLFTMPEISATGNNGTLFNSGVMVIEPSNCTYNLLMGHINDIKSYNGGDQGYLNEIFTWWHRIPRHMNFLKHFWIGDEEEKKAKKTRLFGAEPPILYVLHYLGYKPWLCFRDYDCNWNVDFMQEFASDVAHHKWWKVHDSMPKKLQKFCLLSTHRKANLEWDRRQAEKANYSDGHWKRNVSDERLRICKDSYCDWKSMLLHWGDPMYDDGGPGFQKLAKKLPSL